MGQKCYDRAARVVSSNYCFETASMTGILEKLNLGSLKKRRRDSRLIILYKGLKGVDSIPTDDLIPPNKAQKKSSLIDFSDLRCKN